MLAETDANTETCGGEILAILLRNGSILDNGTLMLKSPNSPMACRLQITWDKVTDTVGRGLAVLLGLMGWR